MDGTEARSEIHSFAVEMMDLLGTICKFKIFQIFSLFYIF